MPRTLDEKLDELERFGEPYVLVFDPRLTEPVRLSVGRGDFGNAEICVHAHSRHVVVDTVLVKLARRDGRQQTMPLP
ncbi:hypothetical protein COU19_01220 [Candidatus Kaiserbacteria bacterium CG10_big_fil_rev_8_21_14_0_10_56_12]|uniref:Uncharacterized protein n=1 Tax=Candidatus Kaiserbacteria bacterium CG10_big_fil_rev_8_21_14_0_10_56_12 TaxID=1974611 RepID=A0A2H0UC36_9BACT|nr:MAG: hypothetical protein COU19_01220 [Candidatus Kaiserbacteria bacterium CG10_big_fil_rev_8_21_14_0_10_56_12]